MSLTRFLLQMSEKARPLIARLLTMRASDRRRTGKAWREGRDACATLPASVVIVAWLDEAKQWRMDERRADSALWHAFCWACGEDQQIIAAELRALIVPTTPRHLIVDANVWLRLHPQWPTGNY